MKFTPIEIAVIAIVCIIIGLQIFFFIKNRRRMTQFKNIFENIGTWSITWDPTHNFVTGVSGEGNSIFQNIIDSINKYLNHSVGSVIDFGLLKDAVDRHFDSVEDEISTQTPIPLYWGLAGTMAGVILGLGDLLHSDAINTLMGSGAGQIDSSAKDAALGINSLLMGVAWAMFASICGIILTTINSLGFKSSKQEAENGKNSFLGWMQSKLLPELPSDTSDALNKLVVNLNKFNNTFADNTKHLRSALSDVNSSYKIQADVIKYVHDMDVMKMANANVRVLKQLNECTDKLEVFNQYLYDIEGYTESIHRFEELFNKEADRLHVLEEIKDFFHRHKGEIARSVTDADVELQDSLRKLKEKTAENVSELNKNMLDQSQEFKDMLTHQKEVFTQFTEDLRTQFSEQMTYMPQMARKLSEVSEIPKHIEKLIDRIEKSNQRLADQLSHSARLASPKTSDVVSLDNNHENYYQSNYNPTPFWMKWAGLSAVVIIAIACIFNVVTYFVPRENTSETLFETYTEPTSSTAPTDSVQNDSVKNASAKIVTDSVKKPTNSRP